MGVHPGLFAVDAAPPDRQLALGDEVQGAGGAVTQIAHWTGALTRLAEDARATVVQVEDGDGNPHVVVALGTGHAFHRCAPMEDVAGPYEARYGLSAAVARDAEFVTHCAADGGFAVAGMGGTVIVRSPASPTVVLHGTEAVLVDAGGIAGPVVPTHELALEASHELAVLGVERAGSTNGGDPAVSPAAGGRDGSRKRAAGRPWQAAVIAGAALVAGVVSLLVGRSGTAATAGGDRRDRLPVAVAGPPAVDIPAFQSAVSGADERDEGVRRPGQRDLGGGDRPDTTTTAPSGPPATAPAPAPAGATPAPSASPTAVRSPASPSSAAGFALSDLRCAHTGPTSIRYGVTISNTDAVAATATARVEFLDAAGHLVGSADAPAARVGAHGTSPVTATATGDALRQAVSCEVASVDVVLGQLVSPLAS